MTHPDHLSRLPDEPEYWERLQSRIEGAVLADLADAGASANRAWYAPLARRAWLLSTVAAAAAVAVSFLPRDGTPSAEAAPAPMLIPPSAESAQLSPLMTREAPPGIAELLVTTAQSRTP